MQGTMYQLLCLPNGRCILVRNIEWNESQTMATVRTNFDMKEMFTAQDLSGAKMFDAYWNSPLPTFKLNAKVLVMAGADVEMYNNSRVASFERIKLEVEYFGIIMGYYYPMIKANVYELWYVVQGVNAAHSRDLIPEYLAVKGEYVVDRM